MTARAVGLMVVETPADVPRGWPNGRSASVGYGLLLCEDPSTGERYTLMCGIEYARIIDAAINAGVIDDATKFPMSKFPFRRDGWPDVAP